jgi:molybdopterin-guanine dinucleotide biosynthesis protein A
MTVAILAGGKSRRMGTDKSFIMLEGKPLIQHVIERASTLNCPIILIANDVERYSALGLPVYTDVIPNAGSLGGLYSALMHSTTANTLCLACDMPRISPPLLAHLATLTAEHDAVVPRVDGVAQSLHAIYHRHCLPIMYENVITGRLKISPMFDELKTRFVEGGELRLFDPDGTSFVNVNTPAELERFASFTG